MKIKKLSLNLLRILVVLLVVKENITMLQKVDYISLLFSIMPVIVLLEIIIATGETISKDFKKTKKISTSTIPRLDKNGRRNITNEEKEKLLKAIKDTTPANGDYSKLYSFKDEFYTHDLLVKNEEDAMVLANLICAVDKEILYIDTYTVLVPDGRFLIGLRKVYDHNNNYHEYELSNEDITASFIIEAQQKKEIVFNQEMLNYLYNIIVKE